MEIETEMESGGINDIAETLLDKMPTISEHVILQEQEQRETKAQNANLDINGAVFDPSIHCADESGNPVKTAAGAFRKKSGRKSGGSDTVKKSFNSQLGIKNDTQANSAPLTDPQTVMAGKAAAALTFQAGIIIGGEEWQPQINVEYGLNEPAMLEMAYIDYFKSQGIVDFPPGVALTIALISYAAPRFIQPKTKSRLAKVVDWFKSKFGGKKQEPEKEDK